MWHIYYRNDILSERCMKKFLAILDYKQSLSKILKTQRVLLENYVYEL